MLSVEISPPTFLILFTWAVSFLSLGRGLSILFTISRNELLVLLILFYFFKPLFISSLVLFLSADFRFFFFIFLCLILPGKSHGWRSLTGFSPWGRKESDMTE